MKMVKSLLLGAGLLAAAAFALPAAAADNPGPRDQYVKSTSAPVEPIILARPMSEDCYHYGKNCGPGDGLVASLLLGTQACTLTHAVPVALIKDIGVIDGGTVLKPIKDDKVAEIVRDISPDGGTVLINKDIGAKSTEIVIFGPQLALIKEIGGITADFLGAKVASGPKFDRVAEGWGGVGKLAAHPISPLIGVEESGARKYTI